MKLLCIVLTMVLIATSIPLGACAENDVLTGLTAMEIVARMGMGWNLGNTLDANGSGVQQGLESEIYWGQPYTKPELMKMMKEM